MYKYLLIVLSLTACSSLEKDKEAHFIAGAVVSKAVTDLTDSKLMGCAASIGVGVVKEALDKGAGANFDNEDALWTAAGCVLWQIEF